MTHEEVLDEVNVLYERLSHPKDIENGCYSFDDGNYLEALEILIDFYETGLIEELEKIKAEIKDLSLFHNDIFKETHSKSPMRMKEDFIEIINKHISELKGEQK